MYYVIAVVPTVEGGRGGFMYPRAIAALEGGVRQKYERGREGARKMQTEKEKGRRGRY